MVAEGVTGGERPAQRAGGHDGRGSFYQCGCRLLHTAGDYVWTFYADETERRFVADSVDTAGFAYFTCGQCAELCAV